MFSTLTGLKFEIWPMIWVYPYQVGINDAVLALKTFCVILVLMAFVSNGVKNLAECLMNLGGIVSMPLVPFISTFLRRFLISVSLTVLNENL